MNKKDIEAIYPLSSSQQGMLFESLSGPESGIHIEQLAFTFHGDFDLAAFKRAWQRVVKRHSLLRTSFIWKNQDEPLQVVLRQSEIPIEWNDWRAFSPSQQQEQLEAALNADRSHGFNLSKAPLMRLAVFQIGENTYQIVWTLHHILMDGWCNPIILNEVLALYKAFSTNQDLSLEPSPPYRDYILWLKQQDLSAAEKFWQKTLQGFIKPTPLGIKAEPISFSGQEERYYQQEAHLNASVTATLQSLVRQHHLTLNNLVQGVWALLLSRYSGEDDVVFGTTVSGRPPNLAGVESMIGLFINTLPMRIKVSPNSSLWTWLKNIQLQQIEQGAYEYCSAGQVHQWSEVPKYLPLYESVLVFENYPSTQQSSDSTINVRSAFSKGAQTKHALTILINPGTELKFKIIYDCYRLDSADISQILEHFLTLLEKCIVDAPSINLATLFDSIPADQTPKVRFFLKSNQQNLKENFVPPRDTLELQLVQIWEDVLDTRPVGVKDSFFDLGGHSLLAVRLMTQIQQQFEKNLTLGTLFQASTIEQLAEILRQQDISSSSSTLVAIQPHGSKLPFFFVPGGGGNIIYLYDFACCLGSDQPFYALQAPGLDGKSEPMTRVKDIAAHYIKAIETVQPLGPYMLGGHSFGVWVAFEMALQFQARGQQVGLLTFIDEAFQAEREPLELPDDADIILDLYQSFYSLSLEYPQQLSPEDKLLDVIEQLKRANILPPDFGLTQIRSFLRVYRSQLQAGWKYVPKDNYHGLVTLFRNEERRLPEDLTMGWGALADAVEVHKIPGTHITIMSKPNVQVLAEKLKLSLDQVSVNS